MKTVDIEIILSFIFGAIFGLLLRSVGFALLHTQQFYLMNFLVDLGGSFFIGFIFRNPSLSLDPQDKICAMMSLLGGLATFSGFALDILHFIQMGEFQRAFFYFALSNFIAIAGCLLGYQIAIDAE